MAVRKHPTKKGWWQIVISHGRNNPQDVFSFQGTEAEARAYEAEIRGVPAEISDSKVVDLVARFFDWYTIHRSEKSKDGCDYAFKHLLPVLGDRYITLLHQNDYERYKAKRIEDKVCKRTINIELTYFRAFLRWCREEKGLIPGADPKMFSKKDTAPKPTIVPSRAEMATLIDKLKGDKKTIAQLMAWCGLRRNEALNIKRCNVDLANNLLIITGKGNKTRVIPIIGGPLLLSLTEACKKKGLDDYLFVNPKTSEPYKNIRRTLKNNAQAAGINKRMYNHLLRHSFGTQAMTVGVQQRALQGLMGHSDIRTTEIYTHLSAELLQAEAVKLAAVFDPQPDPAPVPKRRKKPKSSDISDSVITKKGRKTGTL